MRVLSVNVGQPRDVEWEGEVVRTAIWKSAIEGPVRVGALNIEGDQPFDLRYHGGVEKAVYAYPSEHYSLWASELPGVDLTWGAFGENLTTEGLSEDTTCIGDRLRIGDVELVVTSPRRPCRKLAMRLNCPEVVEAFQRSGRCGFYLRVAREGTLTSGDAIEFLERAPDALPVSKVLD